MPLRRAHRLLVRGEDLRERFVPGLEPDPGVWHQQPGRSLPLDPSLHLIRQTGEDPGPLVQLREKDQLEAPVAGQDRCKRIGQSSIETGTRFHALQLDSLLPGHVSLRRQAHLRKPAVQDVQRLRQRKLVKLRGLGDQLRQDHCQKI